MMNESEEYKGTWVKFFSQLGIGISLFCILVSILLYPSNVGTKISSDSDDWSNFGEYIGGIVTPFVGVIGLCGVLIAMINQNEENRKLLRQNQKIDTENKILKLIDGYHTVCNSLKIRDKINQKKYWEGRHAFDTLFEKWLLPDYKLRLVTQPNLSDKERVVSSFDELYNNFGNQFGYYFRNLFYVMKTIDESKEIDQKYFAILARAQLSTGELKILMYNCLTERGKEFKPLVEKYGLLNGLNHQRDMLDSEHADFFEKTAFA